MKVYELVERLMKLPSGMDVLVSVGDVACTKADGFEVIDDSQCHIWAGEAQVIDENGDECGTIADLIDLSVEDEEEVVDDAE